MLTPKQIDEGTFTVDKYDSPVTQLEYCIQELQSTLSEYAQIVEAVATMEGGIAIAINDGRKFTKLDWCLFCGAEYDLDGDIEHYPDCLLLQAQKVRGYANK